MKSSPDLGMSIPRGVRQIDHEIPSKLWSPYDQKEIVIREKDCCPASSSTRVK